MKNKKIIVLVIFSILIIVSGILLTFLNGKESIKKLGSKNNYLVYKLENAKKEKKSNNIIVWYNDDGTIKEEFKGKNGTTLKINKFGLHNVTIKKISNDSITISLDGLAPTKKNGTFSLTDKYEDIIVNKNEGLKLNVQATDLYKGYIYFFYMP